MVKFLFSNVIGSFVFDENYKLVDGLLFKDIEQYKNKKEQEEKLKQKHSYITIPKDSDIYNILLFFKNKKYYSQFYNKNLKITKNSIKSSVNDGSLKIYLPDVFGQYPGK